MHPNCRSTTRGYLGEEFEKTIKRRARNPITGKTEIVEHMNYKEWLQKNNIVSIKNGKVKTEHNIIYDTNTLNKLDTELVKNNFNQLNKLLNKYPKVGNFVKDKSLMFVGKTTNAIAVTSHSYDMNRLGIHLSNNYYDKYNNYTKAIKKGQKNGHFMPCSDKNIDKYALNHEFGHLVENYLINEYNISNPAEYSNFKTKIRTATTQYQVNKTFKEYEGKICDKISQDIYDIAIKNNPNFDLSKNLSNYGRGSSQEFFAECFANLESGKPNELGKAMEEYLKGVM